MESGKRGSAKRKRPGTSDERDCEKKPGYEYTARRYFAWMRVLELIRGMFIPIETGLSHGTYLKFTKEYNTKKYSVWLLA